MNKVHLLFLEAAREAERSTYINSAWSLSDLPGLYKSSVALVELEATFKEQFKELSIPCSFVYGEESFPKNRKEVRPDAPDLEELERFTIQIAIVQNAVVQ